VGWVEKSGLVLRSLLHLRIFDFSGAKFIGTALAEDNKKSRAEFDKFVDTIMNGDKAVNEFTDTQKEYLKIEQQIPGAIDKTSRATEKKNKEFNMQLYLLSSMTKRLDALVILHNRSQLSRKSITKS